MRVERLCLNAQQDQTLTPRLVLSVVHITSYVPLFGFYFVSFFCFFHLFVVLNESTVIHRRPFGCTGKILGRERFSPTSALPLCACGGCMRKSIFNCFAVFSPC